MPFKNPHPLYQIWRGMHDRCSNPNIRQWKDYGGRGITVTERWHHFDEFVRDMGPRPEGYTLDRIENDKGYYPANCKWSSRAEQMANRRNTVFVTVEGVKYKALTLAKIAGHKVDTILDRAHRGLPYSEVVRSERFWSKGPPVGSRPKPTHCPQGHDYTPDNTIIINKTTGTRACRTCHNERRRLKDALRSAKLS